jgi:hypothetical protein
VPPAWSACCPLKAYIPAMNPCHHNVLQAKRAQLALAYGRPWAPPPAPPDHRTHLCQEAAWLAVDFAQVRCCHAGCLRCIHDILNYISAQFCSGTQS